MAGFEDTRRAYENAKIARDGAQEKLRAAASAVKRAERAAVEGLRGDQRRRADPIPIAADLKRALTAAERGMRVAETAFLRAERDFAVAVPDPRRDLGQLPDTDPFLLFPVRLETRFKGRELLVRIYPDSLLSDSFEERLSESELKNAKRYWVDDWRADGNDTLRRAAWAALVQAHGTGRARWIVKSYVPVNAADAPKKDDGAAVIVVPSETPVPVSESDAIAEYVRLLWISKGNPDLLRDAQDFLQAKFGADRAAAITKTYVLANLADQPRIDPPPSPPMRVAFLNFPSKPSLREASWAAAPRAEPMPDRFVLVLKRAGVRREVLGERVRVPLYTGFDPSGLTGMPKQLGATIEFPAETRWLADFDEAVKAGMGFRVQLADDEQATGFDRLYAIGLSLSDDAKSGRKRLNRFVEHRLFSAAGFEIVPQGTPTNNTEDKDSGFSFTEDPDAVFDALEGAGLFTVTPDRARKRDGQWLAEALGLDMELAKRILNSGGGDQSIAQAMNAALWPATIGHHFLSLLSPVTSRATVANTHRYFVDHVSGQGRMPAIRIGRQPYGILPVTAFDRTAWLGLEGGHPRSDAFLVQVKQLLDRMDGRFRKFAAGVVQAGDGSEAQQTLLDILGLHPASVEFHTRYGQSAAHVANILGISGLNWSSISQSPSLHANIEAFLRNLGYGGNELPRIASIFFQATQGILDGGVVCSEPRNPDFESEHAGYLNWLLKAGRDSVEALRVQQGIPGGVPKALLYMLLRHALLLAYSEAAGEAHLRLDGFDEKKLGLLLREEPLPHVRRQRPGALASESRWEALYKIEPKISENQQISVAEYLAKNIGRIRETDMLAEQLNALETLIRGSREQLERAFAEHIDLCSYRLDAWELAIPRIQLERMDQRTGTYLGAYGWLEDVRPDQGGLIRARLGREITDLLDPGGRLPPLMIDPANGGLIQAPSLNQAVTGAILRNAYMTGDSDVERESIGVNLSSERVRKALLLADGMRQGQRLNALLGYHFERGLHDRFAEAETDEFILDLRLALPLDSGRLKDTQAQVGEAGKVEARDVVDGLKLVEQMRKTGIRTYPFGLTIAASPISDEQRKVIESEAAKLEDLHDALGDLVLAEAVQQSVQGNFDRVASSLDAFAKGEAPPEPDVVRTPSTGISIAHRVAIHLDANAAPGPSPRATAEPAVNAWLAASLPPMERIGCVARWTDPANGTADHADVTLDALGLTPLDLVHAFEAEELTNFGELDDLVVERVVAMKAGTFRTDAALDIRYMEAPAGAISLFEAAALIRPLAALVKSARPLRPGDLMLEAEAVLGVEDALTFDASGLDSGLVNLEDLITDMKDFESDAKAAQANAQTTHQAASEAVDVLVTKACALALRAMAFGLPQSRPGRYRDAARRLFADIMRSATALADDWAVRLGRCDAALAELPGANDADTIAILRRAETEVPLAVLSGLTAPAALEIAVRAARNAFAAKIATLRALVGTHARSITEALKSFEQILADVQFTTTVTTTASRAEIGAFVLEAEAGVAAVRAIAMKRAATAAAKRTAADSAAGETRVNLLDETAKALFGEGFRIVPQFELPPQARAEFDNALAATRAGETFKYLTDTLKVPFPLDEWLYGIARVREPMRHAETATVLAEAFGAAPPRLEALQFPFRPGDFWLGLDFPKDYDIDRARLLYTAHFATPPANASAFRGLLIDEWSEVIPGIRREAGVTEENVHTQSTGVSFHFDRPNAEAPQSLLLVTPASWSGKWQWEDVVGALDWAWDLARLRAVEPEKIDDPNLSHLLPATVMAAAAREVTISAVLAANVNVAKFLRD
jgi:hypothetical protein